MWVQNNTPMGGETGDDQTVSKEDQMMLEFILPTQVLKNNIKISLSER